MKFTSFEYSKSNAPTLKQPGNRSSLWAVLLVFATLGVPFSTQAGPGHDHGEEAPVSAGMASPRFVLSSDLFDAVGILSGNTLEIYVDHAATNAPVDNATVSLELNGDNVPVELHSIGQFDAVLPEALTKEHSDTPVSVAMTITADDQVDLLAGELVLAHSDELHSAEKPHSRVAEFAFYGFGGLILLTLAVFGMQWGKKRKQAKRGK